MKARTFVGITLFVAGILKLASIWDIIHLDWFENLFAQHWMIYLTPILLIYVGIFFIGPGLKRAIAAIKSENDDGFNFFKKLVIPTDSN